MSSRSREPRHLRDLAREDQVFGSFSGEIASCNGRTYRVDDLFGWAEEVHHRW